MAPKKAKPASSLANGVLPKLKEFYEFMTRNELGTIEIDEAGLHLRMVRRGKAPVQVPVPIPVSATNAPTQTPLPAAASGITAAQHQPPSSPAGMTIKSSMMGIFYRAASPSSPPFVKEGDAVRAGQVLCMIEAMKVFNEVKAEYACAIVKVLIENGKPVKSGQDLFVVARA